MSHLAMPESISGRLPLPTRIHRAARRLTRRLGTHGFGLLVITFLWTVVGVGVLSFGPPDPHVAGHGWLIVRLVAWWGAALLCLSAAVDREGPRRDAFALGFAAAGPLMDASLYTFAWVQGSEHYGWFWATIHLAFLAVATLVAAVKDDLP